VGCVGDERFELVEAGDDGAVFEDGFELSLFLFGGG
jgi:hypothetical protein